MRLVGAPPPHRAAFTLTELLVIMAVIALLVCLRWSAQASTKDRTLIAQCAGNLRQFALALQIYGTENNDMLPDNSGGGSWAIDMPWSTGTMLTQWVSWRYLYCPGTGWRFTDKDNNNLWNYAQPHFRVVGYVSTFVGTGSLNATNANPTLTPQPIQYITTMLPAPRAAQRVLVADATISEPGQNKPANVATYNWTDFAGGYPVHHTSAHLEGSMPMGGNVGMLDGHVEWRKFPLMVPRTTGGAPVFWW